MDSFNHWLKKKILKISSQIQPATVDLHLRTFSYDLHFSFDHQRVKTLYKPEKIIILHIINSNSVRRLKEIKIIKCIFVYKM